MEASSIKQSSVKNYIGHLAGTAAVCAGVGVSLETLTCLREFNRFKNTKYLEKEARDMFVSSAAKSVGKCALYSAALTIVLNAIYLLIHSARNKNQEK